MGIADADLDGELDSDLQVTQFEQIGTLPSGTPLASAVVRNAADAVTQGIEVEAHWAVTDWRVACPVGRVSTSRWVSLR